MIASVIERIEGMYPVRFFPKSTASSWIGARHPLVIELDNHEFVVVFDIDNHGNGSGNVFECLIENEDDLEYDYRADVLHIKRVSLIGEPCQVFDRIAQILDN